MAKSRVSRRKNSKSVSGRYAQSIGETWESVIQNETGRYAGLILVKQHPETGFFGRGQAKVVGTAWADYICMGKNFVCTFDAKTTQNKTRLTLPQKTLHQFVKLKLADSVGIPSFYLTWWRSNNIVCAHFINGDSKWPLTMDTDTAEFMHALEPGWMVDLIDKIKEGR